MTDCYYIILLYYLSYHCYDDKVDNKGIYELQTKNITKNRKNSKIIFFVPIIIFMLIRCCQKVFMQSWIYLINKINIQYTFSI